MHTLAFVRRSRAAVALALVVVTTVVVVPAGPAAAATGDINTVAGNGTFGSGGDGGPATSAQLSSTADTVVDGAGNVYIADRTNDRIRKVAPTGVITTFAGTGTAGSGGDGGPATAAQLNQPGGVALDGAGNLYIADTENHKVRKVNTAGVITTVAGTGRAGARGGGGQATANELNTPTGVLAGGDGSFYISESGNNWVRRVDAAGVITTFAGTGGAGDSGDGGPATAAKLDNPDGLAFDSAGNLYVADTRHDRVRKVDRAGIITAFAGNGNKGSTGDGGPATAATFDQPHGLAFDSAGNLYIAASNNHKVRKVDPAGIITTFAGTGARGFSGDGGPAVSARFDYPEGVATDPDDSVYIADTGNQRLRKVTGPPPPPPTLTATSPASPANDNTVQVTGTSRARTTLALHTDAACTSPVVGTGSAAAFASPGIDVTVGDDTVTAFYATATNSNGVSICSPTSVSYREDSIPPPAPAVTAGPGPSGSSPSPAWWFTGEAGASFDCRLTRGATVIAPFAACTSPKSYDLSAEPDGTYTFSVRQTDVAGNASGVATSDYALDRAAAPPAITSSPTTPGTDATPTWSFTGEPGATFECLITRGPIPVAYLAACSTPHSADLAAQPDGTYTFWVSQTDPAGNTSRPATSTYVLDRSAPPAPTVTAGPGPTGNDPTPTWAFTGEPDASLECELSRGGTVIGPFGPCSSPRTYDLSDQPDGTYTFSVRQRDRAGNVSSSATSAYVLDRTSAPPAITGPGPAGNDATPTWSFAGEAGASFQCQLSAGPTVIAPLAACSSPHTYDLAAQPDGIYTFSVRQTDPAGNTSGLATSGYVLDRAAPGPPALGSSPTTPGNDATPTWSFAGEAGASFQCQLSAGGTVIAPLAACSSPHTYDLAGRSDGTYTLAVRQLDAAGNTSAALTTDYVLDRAAPAAPAVTGPSPDTGNDATPTWAFTGEAGAAFECELRSGAMAITAFGPCASPHTVDLAARPDATYTLAVRQTDPVGNTSVSANSDYSLDRGVPAAPTITAGPGARGSDVTPTWTFTGEPGSAFECELRSGATVVAAFAPCTSPHTYDLSAQGDGTYTFSVRQTDPAGNTSAPATSDYTLDRTAPAAPAVTGPSPNPGNDPTPTWAFTGAGASFECQLSRGGTVVSPLEACTSPRTYDLTSDLDATYTFSVRQLNPVGTPGAFANSEYTLDRSAPAAPALTGPSPNPGNDATPTWSFTGEAGAAFECELSRPGTVVTPFGPCTSPHSADLAARPDGTYTLAVRQTDPAGNTSVSASSDYSLDRTAPAAPALTGPSPNPGNDATPTWAFTGEPGAAFECELSRPGTVVTPFGPCSSPHSADLAAQPDGTYTLSVRQTDAAGNTSASASSDYTLDRSAPAAPALTGPSPNPGNDATPTWSFTGEAGAAFECELRSGASVVSAFGPCSSPHTVDLASQPDRTYTLSVRQRDVAGNPGPEAAAGYTLDRAAPGRPSIIPSNPSPGTDTTPSWSLTGEPGATYDCELTRDGTVVAAFTPCSSPFTYDLSPHPDGTYTLAVRQRDAAGNIGAPATNQYVLDRAGPPPPPVVSPGVSGSEATPTWTFTGEPGARFTCELFFGPTVVAPRGLCSNPFTYDLNGQPDGTYILVLNQIDLAGNTSPPAVSEFTLSRSATAGPAGEATSSSPPVASGSSPDAAGRAGSQAPAGVAQPEQAAGPTKSSDAGPTRTEATRPEAGLPPPPASSPATLPVTGPQPEPHASGPDGPPGAKQRSGPNRGSLAQTVAEVLGTVVEVAVTVAGKTAFPAVLLVIVAMFLAVQDRIDKKDPKLALAPIRSEPLDFIDPGGAPISN